MRLLKKTVTSYFIFSSLLLLAFIPVFYFVLKAMIVYNVDEELMATKSHVMPRFITATTNQTEFNTDFPGYEIVFIKEQPVKIGDSIYNVETAGTYPGELLPGRELSSHFYVNQECYRLQIKISMVDKLLLIKRIIFVICILLIVLLLGLLIINRVLTRKILAPFYDTLKQLREYRVDKKPALKFKQTSITEFNELNKTLEELTERDQNAYASQKEFIENASHEMQSPLAVFQSKLEMLMQTKPLTEEQATLIGDLANATKRMERLNKSLVILTKIENNQFNEKETVSIKDVLEKLVEQYRFQIKQKAIECILKVENDLRVEANKTLIEILLGNLLSNAIRHNLHHGYILIEVKGKELFIQNPGKSTSLDTEKVFQRFQKESSDSNSIGLGLAIVKKICTVHNYFLQYQFTGQLHTFSIRF